MSYYENWRRCITQEEGDEPNLIIDRITETTPAAKECNGEDQNAEWENLEESDKLIEYDNPKGYNDSIEFDNPIGRDNPIGCDSLRECNFAGLGDVIERESVGYVQFADFPVVRKFEGNSAISLLAPFIEYKIKTLLKTPFKIYQRPLKNQSTNLPQHTAAEYSKDSDTSEVESLFDIRQLSDTNAFENRDHVAEVQAIQLERTILNNIQLNQNPLISHPIFGASIYHT